MPGPSSGTNQGMAMFGMGGQPGMGMPTQPGMPAQNQMGGGNRQAIVQALLQHLLSGGGAMR